MRNSNFDLLFIVLVLANNFLYFAKCIFEKCSLDGSLTGRAHQQINRFHSEVSGVSSRYST